MIKPVRSLAAPKVTTVTTASAKILGKAVKPIAATAKKTAKTVAPGKVAAIKAAPSSSATAKPPISGKQRLHYIEVAAYFIAERRGFAGASPHEDWAQAEREIDRLLSEGKLNP